MKIRISDIPAEGLSIENTISLEAINLRMKEGRYAELLFTEAPKVSITVHKTLSGAETKGVATGVYKQRCGRCMDPIERTVEVKADFVLTQRAEGAEKRADDFEDDIGVLFYSGEIVDLEEAIQENLILGLSLYWSPPLDEDEKCEFCGVKAAAAPPEEKTINLGELLNKAFERKH